MPEQPREESESLLPWSIEWSWKHGLLIGIPLVAVIVGLAIAFGEAALQAVMNAPPAVLVPAVLLASLTGATAAFLLWREVRRRREEEMRREAVAERHTPVLEVGIGSPAEILDTPAPTPGSVKEVLRGATCKARFPPGPRPTEPRFATSPAPEATAQLRGGVEWREASQFGRIEESSVQRTMGALMRSVQETYGKTPDILHVHAGLDPESGTTGLRTLLFNAPVLVRRDGGLPILWAYHGESQEGFQDAEPVEVDAPRVNGADPDDAPEEVIA